MTSGARVWAEEGCPREKTEPAMVPVDRKRLAALEAENRRLKDWLLKIEGGDNPCTDERVLRQWAYNAVTLGHECQ